MHLFDIQKGANIMWDKEDDILAVVEPRPFTVLIVAKAGVLPGVGGRICQPYIHNTLTRPAHQHSLHHCSFSFVTKYAFLIELILHRFVYQITLFSLIGEKGTSLKNASVSFRKLCNTTKRRIFFSLYCIRFVYWHR